MGIVSLTKCESYDLAGERIAKLLSPLGGMSAFIKPGMRVLVKPNAVIAAEPDAAICTHPSVCAAVCREIIRAGATPVIVESPGGPFTAAWVNRILDGSGIWPACKQAGAQRNEDFTVKQIACPGGKKLTSVKVVNAALTCDAIVNICKLKTHGMMLYSGAVKNLFGLVPGREKPMMHARFPDDASFASQLNDLCVALIPALHIIDGVVGMEGNGPTSGTPRPLGLLFAGANPWEADHVASGIIGLKIEDFMQNRDALERGLYQSDSIEVAGEDPCAFACNFRMPTTFHESGGRAVHMPKLIQRLFRTRPIVTEKCAGCGVCAQNCPMNVIEMRNRRAVIHMRKCIRCYCCQELCPHHAVDAGQSRLSRMLRRG